MKKLKIDLNGIGELLSKEQMKMVTGGDGYIAGYVLCHYYLSTPLGHVPLPPEGHSGVNLGPNRECADFCRYLSNVVGAYYDSCQMFLVDYEDTP